MNVIIANKLVSLRKQYNLSQEDLAEKLGISRQAISKWERAESSPDTDNLISLAKLYNISLDELLLNDDSSGLQTIEYERVYNSQYPNRETKILENPPAVYIQPAEKESTDEKIKKKHRIWDDFPLPVVVGFIYVFLGLTFDWWHPGWIIFMLIPLYYWILESFFKK